MAARTKTAARKPPPLPDLEDEPRSNLPVWLGIGGGGVVILGLLIALIAWCYAGSPKEPILDGFVLAGLPTDKKPEPKDPTPAPVIPKRDDVNPKLDLPPNKDPDVNRAPNVGAPNPKIVPLNPDGDPKDPIAPIVKKDSPKEKFLPLDTREKTKSVLPPIKSKGSTSFIVPLFVTEDFKEAKLPYKVRHLKLPDNFKPKTLRLAVTPPASDDMGRLLDDLGDGFRYANITANDLSRLERLQQFDVVFLTCGGGGENGASALRKFVEGGGTLYASDLRYDLVLQAFPETRPNYQVEAGNGDQTVKADIVDSGLKQYLGRSSIPLRFDGDGWRPAIFDKKKTKSVMEGYYWPQDGGKPILARLMVKFRSGDGNVIFTSFHNAAQNNELERKLLKYLVFTAITARQESKVNDLLLKEGFTLVEMKNHQLSMGKSTPKQTINHGKGGLQFAVGYDALGAKLRLNLIAPDGQKIEHEDDSMFLLEIPSAPSGAWTYTVTATRAPFASFPFVLAVGKKN